MRHHNGIYPLFFETLQDDTRGVHDDIIAEYATMSYSQFRLIELPTVTVDSLTISFLTDQLDHSRTILATQPRFRTRFTAEHQPVPTLTVRFPYKFLHMRILTFCPECGEFGQ